MLCRAQLSPFLQWAFLQREAHDGKPRHMPLLALGVLSQAIARMHLRSPCQADLQMVMERFMGMCATNERICRTPIPMPYSRCGLHARRQRCARALCAARRSVMVL